MVIWKLGGVVTEVGGGASGTKPEDEQKMFSVWLWFFLLEPDQEEWLDIKPKCGEWWYLISHQNISSMTFKCHMKKSILEVPLPVFTSVFLLTPFITVSPYYIWYY